MRCSCPLTLLLPTAFAVSGCTNSQPIVDPSPSPGATATATAAPVVGPGTLILGSTPDGAIPRSLVIASPTTVSAAQAIIVGQIIVKLTGENPIAIPFAPPPVGPGNGTPADFQSKKEALEAVLDAKTIGSCDDLIPNMLDTSSPDVPCYGPPITLTNPQNLPGMTSVGANDLGIFTDTNPPNAGASGEACSAAKVNILFATSGRYADYAMAVQAMLVCAAKVKQVSLPEVSQSLDLAPLLTDVGLAAKGITVAAARVDRLADSAAGRAVYKTSVHGTLKTLDNVNHPFDITVTNSPDKQEAEAAEGVLNFLVNEVTDMAYPGAVFSTAISVRYASTAASALSYRYRMVRYEMGADDTNTPATMFDSASEVALVPAQAGGSTPHGCVGTGWCQGYHESIASIDGDGFGKASYAQMLNNSRGPGTVFNIATARDGTGVAYSGYTANEDVLGTDKLFKIAGAVCMPHSGPFTLMPYVQKQVLKMDTTSKKWLVAENGSYVTMTPTSTCSWNTDNDPGHTATFVAGRPGEQYNETLTFPRNHNLYSQTAYASEWQGPVLAY